jgi:hypothetical protein
MKSLLLAILVYFFLMPCTAVAVDSPNTTTINKAELHSLTGVRNVDLPHVLNPEDFHLESGRARYRLTFYLDQVPQEPLGIYVRKLSLSGGVYLNGNWVGECGYGRLENLICHYRPFMVVPPLVLWKQGFNTIEVEVYAIPYLMNGLAPVEIGNANYLESASLGWRYFAQVDVVRGLTWLATLLGFMSIMIGIVLRRDSIYLWFGCVCLTYAVSNINVLVVKREISMQLFGWMVFSGQFVSIFLLLPSTLMFFDKLSLFNKRLSLVYVALAVAAIAVSANNNIVVMLCYSPLLILTPWMLFYMVRWTRQTRQPRHVAATLMWVFLFSIGIMDGLRLGGKTSYEGVYYITYAYGLVLVLLGALLIGLVAASLNETRTLTVENHEKLLALESERSKLEERERVLQDMHDGFGSQLASARFSVERGQLTQQQLSDVLSECMSDLYLVVDTFSNADIILENAVADMRFRTTKRFVDTQLQFHWNVQLQDAPAIPQSMILQILRITQEALNNVIKHAQAHHVWLRFVYHQLEHSICIAVRDDGVGFSADSRPGVGQNNMQVRARKLNATLDVNPSSSGTTVTLNVPLTSAA